MRGNSAADAPAPTAPERDVMRGEALRVTANIRHRAGALSSSITTGSPWLLRRQVLKDQGILLGRYEIAERYLVKRKLPEERENPVVVNLGSALQLNLLNCRAPGPKRCPPPPRRSLVVAPVAQVSVEVQVAASAVSGHSPRRCLCHAGGTLGRRFAVGGGVWLAVADLLEDPSVAVWVGEVGEAGVVAVLPVGTGLPAAFPVVDG